MYYLGLFFNRVIIKINLLSFIF